MIVSRTSEIQANKDENIQIVHKNLESEFILQFMVYNRDLLFPNVMTNWNSRGYIIFYIWHPNSKRDSNHMLIERRNNYLLLTK